MWPDSLIKNYKTKQNLSYILLQRAIPETKWHRKVNKKNLEFISDKCEQKESRESNINTGTTRVHICETRQTWTYLI